MMARVSMLAGSAPLGRAATALDRLIHGRERERAAVLRAGAPPFAGTPLRLAREALGR